MLLVHQAGSVRVGEVVRYTLTYTPSEDRILPSPSHLHVKVKNTSAIPLRAAYLHGPYTLYVSCYPSTFDPNCKHENVHTEGAPQFEPNLKAAGNWNAKLTVPEDIRQTASDFANGTTPKKGRESFTWVIDIASQVIFSTSAAVHFEVLVGRDEKSVELGFAGLTGTSGATPGHIGDHALGKKSKKLGRSSVEGNGIYSKAVDLVVDDTGSLWNTPEFPSWKDGSAGAKYHDPGAEKDNNLAPATSEGGHKRSMEKKPRKRKRVHLVVLTHGLHSNLGADMLYLKESIDRAAAQARLDARNRREEVKMKQAEKASQCAEREHSGAVKPPNHSASVSQDHESDDEEQVIVRGFSGNAVRTERGIQYLGKRLAKYVLHMTYPDQPYLPTKKSTVKSLSRSLTGQTKVYGDSGSAVHARSSIHRDDQQARLENEAEQIPHKITSISFISHSLGGLIQTYAIAYIHKHSPEFFYKITPINFVAMATPFLGLSNENPIYVKFALDFGLVGRTGQDLGLTWRPPNMVRSGWAQMIGGLGNEAEKPSRQSDPGAKPLLRILPSGPAHEVLKRFRNRTVYSNVVNDGIVPLRTSCLLFLDWRGLGRVEKARRENGLVGTVAGWGWAELTGANSSSPRLSNPVFHDDGDESSNDGRSSPRGRNNDNTVPQPAENETTDDNVRSSFTGSEEPEVSRFLNARHSQDQKTNNDTGPSQTNPLSSLISFFKPQDSSETTRSPTSPLSNKKAKIYKRSQTIRVPPTSGPQDSGTDSASTRPSRVRGDSLYGEDMHAPPKTTFFESAGDLLNPPLPPEEFLIDPTTRPRTIFHDRIYCPQDIPPPPVKRPKTIIPRTFSNNSVSKSNPSTSASSSQPTVNASEPTGQRQASTPAAPVLLHPNSNPSDASDSGSMKVEEKIARAYHRDLSWRKVLVRLEPDAHNNMVVRRMFANAYGWPVVKHLVDTHFAFTVATETDDTVEGHAERAKPTNEPPTCHGEEVEDQVKQPEQQDSRVDMDSRANRSQSEAREMQDSVPEMVIHPTSPAKPSSTWKSPNSPGKLHSSQSSGSSKASVTRSELSRSESGRWSDRYLEDSDEGASTVSEDLDPRMGPPSPPQTRVRRGIGGQLPIIERGEAPGEPRTSEEEIVDLLGSHSITSELARTNEMTILGKEGSNGSLVAEPDSMAKSGVTEDLTSLPPLTGVGLGKKTDYISKRNDVEERPAGEGRNQQC